MKRLCVYLFLLINVGCFSVRNEYTSCVTSQIKIAVEQNKNIDEFTSLRIKIIWLEVEYDGQGFEKSIQIKTTPSMPIQKELSNIAIPYPFDCAMSPHLGVNITEVSNVLPHGILCECNVVKRYPDAIHLQGSVSLEFACASPHYHTFNVKIPFNQSVMVYSTKHE